MSNFSAFPKPRKPFWSGRNLVILLAILAPVFGLSWLTMRYFFIRDRYTQGERAYQAAECDRAIAEYEEIIDNPLPLDLGNYQVKAREKQTECGAFQAAINRQQAGDFEAALLSYDDFLAQYPASALAAPIREQTQNLFTQNPLPALAQPQVCNRLDPLQQHQLIPQAETTLPSLYYACGQTYAAASKHGQAIQMYEQFLDRYSQHELTAEVKSAWAKSMVAEAKAQGAGSIARPGRSGSTGDGSTVVEIRNDSPEKVRMVFSGPEPRFEELAPCTDCQKFVGNSPNACPNKGPVGTYKLQPGEYEVVVKSISDRAVRPFTGSWSLGSNAKYSSCFFIVEQPGTTIN